MPSRGKSLQGGHSQVTLEGKLEVSAWIFGGVPSEIREWTAVLVVDDEPSIVDAVATSLRYEGFTVDEAVTGRRALAQAQEDPPDLVILDVMLPDLDGLEVTRRRAADGVRCPSCS